MAVVSGSDWRRGLPDPEWREYILKARERFLKGEAVTAAEVRRVFRRAAQRVRRDLEAETRGTARWRQLERIQELLDQRAREMSDELLAAIRAGIDLAATEAVTGAQQIGLEILEPIYGARPVARMFATVNERAVVATLARTGKDGLKLSDRIWRTSERARNAMRRIVEEGVARGQDPRKLARELERYLQPGVHTPLKMETAKRLGVPTDLSREALRLAVTEMHVAFHEGTVLSHSMIPSYRGSYWRLSASHPVKDICDDYATRNGDGFFPKGKEPEKPHPWCRCVLVPVHEEPDALMERLQRWMRDPTSEPEIESWYTAAREFLPRPSRVGRVA